MRFLSIILVLGVLVSRAEAATTASDLMAASIPPKAAQLLASPNFATGTFTTLTATTGTITTLSSTTGTITTAGITTGNVGALNVSGASNFTGNLIQKTDDGGLLTDTVDTADNQCIFVGSAGAIGVTRGSHLRACGNEDATVPGAIQLTGGQVATGHVSLVTNHASATSIIYGGNGAPGITVAATEVLLASTHTLRSANAGSIGWSIVAGADTACTATCTSACVMGFADTGGVDAAVDCADATADSCLCAGPS